MVVTESQAGYRSRMGCKPKEEARRIMAAKPTTSLTTVKELEARLKSRVVGQESQLQELMQCYKRYRAGLNPAGRPVGIFLMIGPTGSGKSLAATTFAKAVTGSTDSPLRIDCGEYSQAHEVAKLIGSPPGYLGHRETPALLNKASIQKQHTPDQQLSVVLFDEIDKAHPRFLDLLLGILDTGKLTLGDNSVVDFTNSIILLTGNTGSRQIQEAAKPTWGLGTTLPLASNPQKQGSRSAEESARKMLRPEMFNRLDKVIVFNQLDQMALRSILELELEDLQSRLASKGISLVLTEPVKELICADGADPRYGARHLKRSLTKHIELPLADLICDESVEEGQGVHARVRDGAIELKPFN